ncbi:unnamed protein product [Caenorhabditis angaria]|uniref:Tyr recombinase domain-containing protein n=1 Tax=Caenorhabditis angaria TaxID=860376 RepID=A0A9P1IH65_9PELO|nr:unnamed protein product [Caenorhabditis angaria]
MDQRNSKSEQQQQQPSASGTAVPVNPAPQPKRNSTQQGLAKSLANFFASSQGREVLRAAQAESPVGGADFDEDFEDEEEYEDLDEEEDHEEPGGPRESKDDEAAAKPFLVDSFDIRRKGFGKQIKFNNAITKKMVKLMLEFPETQGKMEEILKELQSRSMLLRFSEDCPTLMELVDAKQEVDQVRGIDPLLADCLIMARKEEAKTKRQQAAMQRPFPKRDGNRGARYPSRNSDRPSNPHHQQHTQETGRVHQSQASENTEFSADHSFVERNRSSTLTHHAFVNQEIESLLKSGAVVESTEALRLNPLHVVDNGLRASSSHVVHNNIMKKTKRIESSVALADHLYTRFAWSSEERQEAEDSEKTEQTEKTGWRLQEEFGNQAKFDPRFEKIKEIFNGDEVQRLDLWQNVVNCLEKDRAPTTIKIYEHTMRSYIRWKQRSAIRGRLGEDECRLLFLAELIKNEKAKSAISANCALNYYMGPVSKPNRSLLNSIIEAAKRSKSPTKHREKVEPEDYSSFTNIQEFDRDSLRVAALGIVLFRGLLRISEALNLRKEDAEWERGELKISIRTSKTDKYHEGTKRLLVLSPEEQAIWRAHSKNSDNTSNPYIFQNWNSKTTSMSYNNARKVINDRWKKCGNAKNYGTHAFRGGAASAAINEGVSAEKVLSFGRWKTEKAFRAYVKPTTRISIPRSAPAQLDKRPSIPSNNDG